MPKLTQYLDDEESKLFRPSYRIDVHDIVDVSFLYRNSRFQRYRDAALNAIKQDYTLGERMPFYAFSEGRLPGEKVIVDRIVYNALQRLGLGAELSSGQLVVVTGFDDSGYRSKSLEMLLSETLALGWPNGKEALVISFYDPYESHDGQSLVSAPVPEISVAPCADREAFRRLMREMNQPEERGRKRYSIVLHRPEDLLRLSRAIMVKQVLEINGGRGPEASLLKFIPGRVIEVPDSGANRDHLIDAAAARYFYHSSGHFYSEALEDIEAALGQLDEEFQKPGLRHLFDSTAAPGQGDR